MRNAEVLERCPLNAGILSNTIRRRNLDGSVPSGFRPPVTGIEEKKPHQREVEAIMAFGRKWLKPLALGLAALLISSAVASAETVLRRGNGAEPETLDPHKSTGVTENVIENDLFEGLVTFSPDGEGRARRRRDPGTSATTARSTPSICATTPSGRTAMR